MNENDFEYIFRFKNIERYIYVEWQYKHLLEFSFYEPQRIQKLSNRWLLDELLDSSFDETGSTYDECLYIVTFYSIKEELEKRLEDWLQN